MENICARYKSLTRGYVLELHAECGMMQRMIEVLEGALVSPKGNE